MKKILLAASFLAIAIAFCPAAVVAQSDYSFVPLTNLPGINDVANSETLPSFFNNLYRLCIGAAAVIAILQIMRAGVHFMFNKGSVAQNEQGKRLITNSVLGLLLVLSPAIVFGIINPDILNLDLDVSGLQVENQGLRNSDLSQENRDSGQAYLEPREVCVRAPSNSTLQCDPNARCGSGLVKVRDSICTLRHTGAICCARLPDANTGSYVLAFTYMQRRGDGPACRQTYGPTYFASLGQGQADPTGQRNGAPGCDAAAARQAAESVAAANNITISDFVPLKSCEQIIGTYTIPAQYRQTCQ